MAFHTPPQWFRCFHRQRLRNWFLWLLKGNLRRWGFRLRWNSNPSKYEEPVIFCSFTTPLWLRCTFRSNPPKKTRPSQFWSLDKWKAFCFRLLPPRFVHKTDAEVLVWLDHLIKRVCRTRCFRRVLGLRANSKWLGITFTKSLHWWL